MRKQQHLIGCCTRAAERDIFSLAFRRLDDGSRLLSSRDTSAFNNLIAVVYESMKILIMSRALLYSFFFALGHLCNFYARDLGLYSATVDNICITRVEVGDL